LILTQYIVNLPHKSTDLPVIMGFLCLYFFG